MSYTVSDCRIFQVRNSKTDVISAPVEEKKEDQKDGEKEATGTVKVADPRLRIDFCGFRAAEKPCKMEIYLHNTFLQIDKDQISGYLRMRELAPEI